jgi:hydroxyacylglutathione hydrolase
VLDVRRPDEWDDSHIAGATHVPFYELEERMDEVPDPEVWVHCVSGFRAAIAASLLDRAGRRAVLIDEAWEQASEAGAHIES